MKAIKILAAASLALLLSISARAESILSNSNGLAAGQALLSLYTQYKTDGKLDLKNTANITNLVSLITNVKGLKSGATVSNTPASFISGLLSGSDNLVSGNNANNVLSTLGSIAGLDANAIATSVAKNAIQSATAKATSGILSKLGGSSSKATTSSASSTAAASTAVSALSSLFGAIK